MGQTLHELTLDHLVFRVRDLTATRSFYGKLFGEPLSENEDSLMYRVGEARLFFTPAPETNHAPYNKEQPGLNHFAFGVSSLACLREILNQLNIARLEHSGIRIDGYGKREFIWLDDPDGFRLEFYFRPTDSAD
jgi:catechol-2,3-dioxygenase